MNSITAIGLGAFVFSLVMFVLWPIALIWAWNILFGSLLLIPYTFHTWLAVFVFSVFLGVKNANFKVNNNAA